MKKMRLHIAMLTMVLFLAGTISPNIATADDPAHIPWWRKLEPVESLEELKAAPPKVQAWVRLRLTRKIFEKVRGYFTDYILEGKWDELALYLGMENLPNLVDPAQSFYTIRLTDNVLAIPPGCIAYTWSHPVPDRLGHTWAANLSNLPFAAEIQSREGKDPFPHYWGPIVPIDPVSEELFSERMIFYVGNMLDYRESEGSDWTDSDFSKLYHHDMYFGMVNDLLSIWGSDLMRFGLPPEEILPALDYLGYRRRDGWTHPATSLEHNWFFVESRDDPVVNDLSAGSIFLWVTEEEIHVDMKDFKVTFIEQGEETTMVLDVSETTRKRRIQ